MELDMAQEAQRLSQMTVVELRERHVEVVGEECRSRHKDFLRKRILWRLQANASGGLSERARQRAEELANDADLRLTPPRPRTADDGTHAVTGTVGKSREPVGPLPGTLLRREYKGRNVQVMVLDKGFEFEGKVYRSLTAIAEAVTGAHWNGMAFFGLRAGGGRT